MARRAAPARPGRILVRAPNWIGDAVMATPALRALRAGQRRAEIVLEGPPAVEALLRGLPSFDRFSPDPGPGALAQLRRARRLEREGYDWAVLLPDSPRAALGPWLARVPRRVGYARTRLRRALLTDPLEPPGQGSRRVPISMIERYLRVTRALGCPDAGDALELVVPARASERVERFLEGRTEPAARLLAITPGARFGASKVWPAEHFARAADALARRHGLRVVLAPGPGEEPIAAAVADRMREPALVWSRPPADIEELKALLARSELLLVGDTGPRHLAVALGTPVVVVMGPTDPRHTAHHPERQRVLREELPCSPCHLPTCPIDHRCMTRLAPERVVAAAEELLA